MDDYQSRKFVVCGDTYTYEQMATANETDEDFCHWLAGAEIGDVFADGEGCERVA